MAKEFSSAGNFFNKDTIKYITNYMKTKCYGKKFDFVKEIRDFLSLNSNQFMIKEKYDIRPIPEKDLIIETNDRGKYIKCIKNFKLKNFIINEIGLLNFPSEN